MKSSDQDTELFMKLMDALQMYTNQKLKVFPHIKTMKDYKKASSDERMEIRGRFYDENNMIIDSFVRDNPQEFSDGHLSIIQEWKIFVKGEFYMERILKNHMILIQDWHVYAVRGLRDDLREFIPASHLPLMIETALLPYKGRIVFDGMFKAFSLFFGGGIKRRLKEAYMAAKQNGRIIDSLDPGKDGGQGRGPIPVGQRKDWSSELDSLARVAKRLKGGEGAHPMHTAAFGLIRASIEFARSAIAEGSEIDDLNAAFKKTRRACNKVGNTLQRQESWEVD